MNTQENNSSGNSTSSGLAPETVAEARRMVTARIERLRYLEARIGSGSATLEEKKEHDDMTWWMNQPTPNLLAPEGTPNPWEHPRPPKQPGS